MVLLGRVSYFLYRGSDVTNQGDFDKDFQSPGTGRSVDMLVEIIQVLKDRKGNVPPAYIRVRQPVPTADHENYRNATLLFLLSGSVPMRYDSDTLLHYPITTPFAADSLPEGMAIIHGERR